jgi:hypothetical protein
VLDKNGQQKYYNETQTTDQATGKPYDKDEESRHHAEQRAKTHVDNKNAGKPDDQKDQIQAIGPSKPCCAGCQKALGSDLDKVDPGMQGKK